MWTRGAVVGSGLAGSTADEDDLGRECEAYLEGRYVEWLEREGLPVRAWARLNSAAHGDVNALRRNIPSALPRRARSWEDAGALISAAVAAVTSAETLVGVQRDVLVPLELELISRTMSPRAAVERVCRALY